MSAAKDISTVSLSRPLERALGVLGRFRELDVLVNDPQRHTDTRQILALLAERFDPTAVRILVAAGSHHFSPEVKKAFEKKLLGGLPFPEIAWHNCRSDDLTGIGGRWRGHPWLIKDAALLAIGSIEPHYFAGFTGAHKTCTIGVASYEDIERNHAGALSSACRPCQLVNNPVYDGIAHMLHALQSHRIVAAVNVVQTTDGVVAAAGGKPLETLEVLIPAAEKHFTCTIPTPADVIVAEVAGPLGRSFYQAEKGIKNNEWAVRDGGVIILAAACNEGIGQDHFVDLLRQAGSFAEAETIIRQRGYRLGDHKASRLRYLTDPTCRGVRVFVVSMGLSDDDAAVLGVTKSASVAAALTKVGLPLDDPGVVHVTDAGNVCLTVQANL